MVVVLECKATTTMVTRDERAQNMYTRYASIETFKGERFMSNGGSSTGQLAINVSRFNSDSSNKAGA